MGAMQSPLTSVMGTIVMRSLSPRDSCTGVAPAASTTHKAFCASLYITKRPLSEQASDEAAAAAKTGMSAGRTSVVSVCAPLLCVTN